MEYLIYLLLQSNKMTWIDLAFYAWIYFQATAGCSQPCFSLDKGNEKIMDEFPAVMSLSFCQDGHGTHHGQWEGKG